MAQNELSGIKSLVKKAIDDFFMLDEGDKLCLGLSGGKDSMALGHILSDFRDIYSFELKVCHIKGSYDGKDTPLPNEIREFFESRGVDYYEENMSLNEKLPMDCYRCSFNRRKALFFAAEKLGCNKIVLAHSKDDLAETVLMNIFTGGNDFKMSGISDYFGGKFYLLRPFYYVSTKAIISYVTNHNIPVFKNPCPLSESSGRSLMREIISVAQKKYPNAVDNILKAGQCGS